MTGRGDLLLAFTAATALHAGALIYGAPLGSDAGGDGGEQRLTLQAATPEIAALVREWERQPEVFQTTALGTPDVPEAAPTSIRPDTQPKRNREPAKLTLVSRSIAPTALAAASPEAPVQRIEKPNAPETTMLAARPDKLPRPTLPDARPEPPPKVDVQPPTLDTAPDQVARPTPRPAKVTSPAAIPRVAEGSGASGKRGTAPATPTTDASKAAQRAAASAWAAAIERRIARHHIYPRNTRDEGRVRVAMVILPDGRLSGVSVAASSGSRSLDNAAVNAVMRAAPFPPAPDPLDDKFFNVGQWIVFQRR
ncbi:MAG: TonB family protein [Silicimonas sp.]|nr:TonB family protein [Silicimonas sp.]